MPKRVVDKRKTSKALRKLRRAADRAGEEGGPGLATWEKDFVEGVTGRLEKYGSAFRDPGKGRLEEALSQRQTHIVRVIDKKSRKAKAPAAGETTPETGKALNSTLSRGSGFKRKSPMGASSKAGSKGGKPGWKPRVRDINDDLAPPAEAPPSPKRPSLRVIPGGRRS
jgi:hypothetical protein